MNILLSNNGLVMDKSMESCGFFMDLLEFS